MTQMILQKFKRLGTAKVYMIGHERAPFCCLCPINVLELLNY